MPTVIYSDEDIVVPLLSKMQLPRWVLLELATKIAGERANVSPVEPSLVAGWETWRWGTRYCREDQALRKLGWESCDRLQVHGIRNNQLGMKLVFCNTDSNTGNIRKSPKNVSEKGNASCKLIRHNSGQFEMDFVKENRDDLWYMCLHCSEQHISMEISRPDSEMAGIISNFSHRIIVAKPGEVPGIRRVRVEQDFADVPRPRVIRKIG